MVGADARGLTRHAQAGDGILRGTRERDGAGRMHLGRRLVERAEQHAGATAAVAIDAQWTEEAKRG